LAKAAAAGTVGGGLWWVKAHMAGVSGAQEAAGPAAQQQTKAGWSLRTSSTDVESTKNRIRAV